MSAKIKLDRAGTKGRPYYRVVVIDRRSAVGSDCIEILGQYNPLLTKDKFNVDKERVLAWISKGAQPTFTVRKLLGKAGILKPLDLQALPKRQPKGKKKEAEAAEGAPKEEKAKEEKKEGENLPAGRQDKEQKKEQVKAEAKTEEGKEKA